MREPSIYFSDEFKKTIFPEYLSSVKNARTRTEYFRNVCILCDYVKKDFLSLSEEDASSFVSYMTERYHSGTMSRKTINLRISCYSSVSRFISDTYEELGFTNPFRDIIRPEVDDSIPIARIPSMEQMDLIMSASVNHSPFYLILALAGRSALSATNIIRLTTNNLFEENGALYVRYESKDHKKEDLVVRLPEDVAALMRRHIESMDHVDAKGHLFYNKHKHPMTLTNLDTGIRKIVKESGVDGDFTIKDIRSRAILDMRSAGAEPVDIAQYTGLSNLRIHSFAKASAMLRECPADLVNYRLKEA